MVSSWFIPIAYHISQIASTNARTENNEALAGEIDDRYITNEVFGPARDKMVAGEATAYEVVPAMNKAIQEILDKYWAEKGS